MTTVSTRRTWLVGAAAATVARPALAEAFHAVVGPGGHSSIAAALASAPRSDAQFRILIKRGVWTEKLTIERPNVLLVGEHRQGAVISFGAYAGQTAPDGQPWGTRRSATLTVQAPGFSARNLTIANSFDISRERPPPGASGFQAVALALTGASDSAALRGVDIIGFQDTLLTDAGRALFTGCRVTGTVDFIFGAGTAFFDRCEVVSRFRQMPGEGRIGFVAAPSTLVDRPYGLIFDRCRLTRETGVPDGSVALGRPWRPTTTFPDGRYGNPRAVGQAVYLRCWMDRHIDPKGWDPMAFNGKDGQRTWFQPEDARFFEFRSEGPGAAASSARRQLSAAEARTFSPERVLGEVTR